MKELTSLYCYTTLFLLPQVREVPGFENGVYVLGNIVAATEAFIVIGSFVSIILVYGGWKKYKGQKQLKQRQRDFDS